MSELIYFVRNGFDRGVRDAMTLKPVRDAMRQTFAAASGKKDARRSGSVREKQGSFDDKATVKKAG